MKIASYLHNGENRFGVVSADETGAVDATEQFGSLKRVLEGGRLDELILMPRASCALALTSRRCIPCTARFHRRITSACSPKWRARW